MNDDNSAAERLRAEIHKGVDDLDRGDVVSGEECFRELQARRARLLETYADERIKESPSDEKVLAECAALAELEAMLDSRIARANGLKKQPEVVDKRLARLKRILTSKSYERGTFTLSSGAQSDVFFDVKRTSLDPEGAWLSADLILDMLQGEQVRAIGGLAMGACPIVSAVCVRSHERGIPISAFYVRKAEKKHGTQRRIEGLELRKGDRVVIVDDVATKGGAMLEAIRMVEELGSEVVRTIVVVDREQGAEERLREAGYRLESLFKRRDLE